jgi:predicted enzyme related to lactoylglutathione lyase
MNLNSILIGSEDPKRLEAYYTKLFGEPTWKDDAYVGWQLGQGALSIGPHDQVHGVNTEPGRVIWNLETPEVKREFDRLVQAGATVVQEPYNPAPDAADMPDMSICTFADPDGNYFQLMSPMG